MSSRTVSQLGLTPCNFRHSRIDSARMYRNEAQVGETVRESGIPRSQIYISAYSVRPNVTNGADLAQR